MKKMKRFLIFVFFVLASVILHAGEPAVRDALQPFVDSVEIPGVVSILWDGGEMKIDCVGWADVEKKEPISEKNVFWIASMTKAFTGAAIMMLVDEGKLSLDDPVEKYLPEFKNVRVAVPNEDGTVTLRAPKVKMTVRHTLCHSAGFSFLTPQQEQFGIDVFPMRPFASTAASIPLLADPEEQYRYSNVGINVASAVLEVVSGMTVEEFFQTRIFDPLGMTDTTFYPTKDQIARMAKCYRVGDGKKCEPGNVPYVKAPFDSPRRFAEAGGGLFSTPEDVMKFYRMLAANGIWEGKRLLSENAMKTLGTKQTPDSIPNAYSLGMTIDGDWIGHGGALQTDAKANPKTNQAWAYFVQLQGRSSCRGNWNRAAAKILKK